MKITPTSLTVQQMLGSTNEQYVIPAYQRRYSWRTVQVGELWDDIFYLDGPDTHLLGTIVCLSDTHTAGIDRLELVDGQQRITTISILLNCLRRRFEEEGDTVEAHELGRLLQAKPVKGEPKPKILLDSLDSKQFDLHISGNAVGQAEIENVHLAEAFGHVTGWINDYDLDTIREFAYKLRNQALMIRLDISDAKDAFKLFETINNRGLDLSATDLIKNFMLGNAARFSPSHLEVARSKWADLIRILDGIPPDNFFRQFMSSRLAKPVTQSGVVAELQAAFMSEVEEAQSLPDKVNYVDSNDEEEADEVDVASDDDEEEEGRSNPPTATIPFEDFLARLVDHARIYAQIVFARTGKAKLDRRLRNLRLIRAQQSYGFLTAIRTGGCSDKNFETILRLTEAFLFRRHTCRERNNETDRVFARLSTVDPSNPIEEIQRQYREYSPPDEKFRDDFRLTQYDSSLIPRARYVLEQIEMDLHGQYPELLPGGPQDVHVEHIIPKVIRTKQARDEFGDWPNYLGPGAVEKHSRYVSRIGNLTIFAGELNIGASNNPYAKKKTAYKNSAIKLTQELPTSYPTFKFTQVESRSKKLAALATTLWPIP